MQLPTYNNYAKEHQLRKTYTAALLTDTTMELLVVLLLAQAPPLFL